MTLKMPALILAAGDGTRMRPLTAHIPKPLLLVAGKPFLQHTIESLKDAGIDKIYILIGWRQERIEEYFGDGRKFGVSIEYLVQDERLGTAHAVGIAKKSISSEFLCLNGDVVVNSQLISALLDFYAGHHNLTTLTLAKVKNPEGLGVVELDKNGYRIKKLIEKPKRPKSDLVNAGVYIFNPTIFEVIEKTPASPRGEYEITDSIRMLINKQQVNGFILDTHVPEIQWVDVGRPWDLITANEVLLANLTTVIDKTAKIEPNVTIKGIVHIGAHTIIKNGTYIEGTVVIGDRCEIGPNCLIRGSTTIGNDCKVGNAVEVKSSIIMDHSNVPHHNYVGDSIIGEHCNLGSGTKVANLRLDEGNVHLVIKGKNIDTGRRKLGVIMGDYVKTGINSVIDVGTIIGEGAFIGPGAIARGHIGPNSKVY